MNALNDFVLASTKYFSTLKKYADTKVDLCELYLITR